MVQIESFEEFLRRMKEQEPAINGPEEIEYGFGWDPTQTYWVGQRRVHFYGDLKNGLWLPVMELADRKTGEVKGIYLSFWTHSWQFIWEIMKLFLLNRDSFADLPIRHWVDDGFGHDSHIPDPPDKTNSGNLVQIIDEMRKKGAKPWHPDESDPE